MDRTHASYVGLSAERLAWLGRRSVGIPRETRVMVARAASRLAPQGADFAAATLIVVMAGLYVGWQLAPAVLGSAACALACMWAARRYQEDRLVWRGLAAGCGALAVSHLLSGLLGSPKPIIGSLSAVDVGVCLFAIGTTTGLVAWPEFHRSSYRLAATVVDLVTVMAAIAVLGSGGLPPLDVFFPALSLNGFARSADALLPVVALGLVLAQLGPLRRAVGRDLGIALVLLLIADIVASPELAPLGQWTTAGWAVGGFGLLFRAALLPRPGYTARDLSRPEMAQPPFFFPGALGAAALAAALIAAVGFPSRPPIQPAFAVVLGAALCAREALRFTEKRRESERLATSMDLESRLLRVHADLGLSLGPRETLREFCCLAADVLKATSALAWIADVDSLVLAAAGPDRSPLNGLLGRRLSQASPDSIAARVFRHGQPEVCDAAAPGARVDRFLATVLGAGPLLAVPVTKAGATIGAFVLVREKGGTPFSVYDRQKAALILAQAAGTLHRYELYQELEDQLRETTLIHRFAVQAVGARTPNDIAWYLLESLRSVFTFDRGQVYLSDRESRRGLTPIAHFHTRAPASERSEPQPSHLTIPLCCGDTIVGSVELQRSSGEPFDSGDHRVATALAQQSATAIQNFWLQEASGKVSTYRELDRVKTDLLNAVSHDFRGALANIKGYASTLLDDDEADTLAEEQRTFLKTIEEEADRLRDLLEHLLDLSKIDAGVLRMDLQTVQIGRIVNEAISSASLRASHTIEQAVPEGLFVMADRRRLRQVLHNLIENAVKYSPEGGAIRVGAMATETEVTVSVSDHGLGIPRHQWDRIFRPYQRAEGPASHAVAGNGLGLAICKGIVEAHGGRIWVESEPNAGSTFSFTVSRAAAPDEESTLSSEPRMAVARK